MNIKHVNRVATPIDIYAGKQLFKRRKELGCTQEVIAERLGISFQQLQKYEKGTNRISISRLYAMSIVLKVPVTYFFPEKEG